MNAEVTNPTVDPSTGRPGSESARLRARPGVRVRWPFIVIGTLLGAVGLCVLIWLAAVMTGRLMGTGEAPAVHAVLDTFMRDMRAKDVEAAYALFSPVAHQAVPRNRLERMLQGDFYALFDGYESLDVGEVDWHPALIPVPDLHLVGAADVEGTIAYEGGYSGHLTATVEKVDGVWMLEGFYVTVPPEKLYQ